MEMKLTDFILVKEASAAWNVTERRVVMYLAEDRIPGAVKVGNTWLIPKGVQKPVDHRLRAYRKRP